MVRARASRGFTLVELLIVIVVIAILAAITIVAYGSVQAKARDSTRKQDLANIAQLLQVRANTDSSALEYGDTCSTASGGWFSQSGTAMSGTNYGAKSASQCLTEEVTGKSQVFTDPSGATSCATGSGTSCYAYLFATCSGNTYIYAHLETVPNTSTDTDSTCNATYDTTWGSNYYVEVATQ